MKTCHRLLRLVDRLSETIRTVQERIRHAVATEIGQAVGQTAQDLLHALLRGGEPRYESEPHRREFDGDIDSVDVDPHDPDMDRPPAVEAVDPHRSPSAGRPSTPRASPRV